MPSKKYYTYSEKEKINAIQEIKDSIIALERDVTKIHQNLKNIGREIYYLYDAMSDPFETTSFSETSEFSSPEEIIEEIVVTKGKKDKCYKPKKNQAIYSFKMATEITGLEDIIDSTSKNIKKVFQNGVKPEDKQETYLPIGLIESDKLSCMAKKSRNNRRKTAGQLALSLSRI
ncbi:10098_t:CDS:2 [Funneliformis geosporum]|uniref:10098_t:CDS:1 n=1 Tax=Funneliformis geosporum TaxID=1117311 RepID=A0A9W4WRA4_9GLOM|nr:10098_t:CDS:2 [Funneliformis geosporum]